MQREARGERIGNDFAKTVDILHRAMDASSGPPGRNSQQYGEFADVPNFKRTVVNFESELKRALGFRGSKSRRLI